MTLTMRAALILSAFALACKTDSAAGPEDPAVDKPFDVKVAETAVLPDEDLHIVFQEVRNDSRCAIGVQCIWEGDAEIVLQVQAAREEREEVRVHTSGRFGTSATYRGYSIQVQELAPPNKASLPTDPKSYVVTLVVSRLTR
jgi:hypothetical protein